jgi:L-lactate dehydrogenase
VLQDERAVIPVGSFNPAFGVTLSLPSVVGCAGVERILEPSMCDEEKQGLQRSADMLRCAVERALAVRELGVADLTTTALKAW